MKISVVIGTYNQKDTLKLVLESLFKQSLSPQEYEIIVIDSSSNDGTDAMLEHLEPTCHLNYIRQENRGKSAARNRGIREARSEIILLTDADMVADQKLLEEHLKAHQLKKSAAFEGLTINPDGKPYIKEKLRPGKKLKWVYFLTGNLSIPKRYLWEAGMFDENFQGYGWEDLELGYRLNRMRVPLYYLPSAVNHHKHSLSSLDMLQRKYNMGKSAAYFYEKHPNFEIKLFLGLNPIAMGIFHFLKQHPQWIKKIKNQYLLEEYYYRLGLTEELEKIRQRKGRS